MGSIGDCFDNSVAESFFASLQLELLDEHRWRSRERLALAIFDRIEACGDGTATARRSAPSTTTPAPHATDRDQAA
jgi:putative transposase